MNLPTTSHRGKSEIKVQLPRLQNAAPPRSPIDGTFTSVTPPAKRGEEGDRKTSSSSSSMDGTQGNIRGPSNMTSASAQKGGQGVQDCTILPTKKGKWSKTPKVCGLNIWKKPRRSATRRERASRLGRDHRQSCNRARRRRSTAASKRNGTSKTAAAMAGGREGGSSLYECVRVMMIESEVNG